MSCREAGAVRTLYCTKRKCKCKSSTTPEFYYLLCIWSFFEKNISAFCLLIAYIIENSN